MAEAGKGSSEFKLTVWVVILGTIFDSIAIGLGTLQEHGVAGKWLAGGIFLVSTVMMLLKALGYTRSRTLVKLGDQVPGATRATKEAVLPLGETLRELVAELREARAGNLPPQREEPLPPLPQQPGRLTYRR
jgi:hypothetical protein